MAVPEQTPYIEHTGNGVTASFSLGFQCESKDHLIVLVDEIEPPIATWSLIGGNVVFTTAPTSGQKITLQRNTAMSRTTNYQSNNNSFRPETINKDIDRVWRKIQELGVRDWLLGLKIQKFRDDVNLTAMEETLEQAQSLRDDTAAFAVDVQNNVTQSQTLLAATTAQANAADLSATSANSSKDLAKQYADNIDASLTAIVGGHKAYQTLALAQADQASLPVNSIVEITNDPTASNNGTYQWNGTALTKSDYDPLTQAKADATTKSNTAKSEAIATAATLSSIGEWLTEDGKTTLSALDISTTADANKLKVIRTIEKIALLNASSSERFYIQSVIRNQGTNGSRIHVQRESQLGTSDRVASLIIANTVTTAGVQEYTVDGTDGIKLKILVNWDNFETNTSALNVNLPINNLKFLKEFQNESQLSNVAEQIVVAKEDATSKASAAETNAKNYTDQFFNKFLINEGASWES